MVRKYSPLILISLAMLYVIISTTNFANAQTLTGTLSSTIGTVGNAVSSVTNTVTNTISNTGNTTDPLVPPVVNSTITSNVTTTTGTLSLGNPLGLPLPDITIPVNASSSVAGVKAFGNGTIATSINGVQMSFWFDPQGPNGKHQSNTVHLIVNAEDLVGNQIPGMFIELQNPNGNDISTGDTQVRFTVISGHHYIIYANSYGNTVFNHWDDGTTNPARPITPSQSVTLTAFYSTGSVTSVPSPPTGLTATAISSSQINLRWNAPPTNDGSQTSSYKIERSADNGTTWSTMVADTGSTTTTFIDSGLGPNTVYNYRVSAINSLGTSSPSNIASARTSQPSQAITLIQSGLVASDSLTNETKTQQQLASSSRYWFFGGDAPDRNAPYSFSRDTNGLHIGIQAPKAGSFAGFYAVSPVHNAKLWHAKITNPVRTTQNQFYENALYVQTANGNVSYVTCTTLTNNKTTAWAVVNATGNTTQITGYEVLFFDQSSNQPLTRDCTIKTNGDNFLQVFFDGSKVYENTHANLQMPGPFNAFLEPQTTDADQFLVGTYQNYYVTRDGNIQVTNLPSNARTVQLVDNTGNSLVSSTASAGNATLGIGQFLYPLAASIQVLDSNNKVIASNTENIYGGDVYSVTSTGTISQQSDILLNNVQSISSSTDSSNQMTISNFNAGTGTNQLLLVGVSANSNNMASVTFGGTPLIKAVSSFNNNDAEFWYLKNPSGTGDVTVTMAGPTQAVVGAYSFSGVNQTSPIANHITRHNLSASSPTISITTKFPNDWVLDLPSIYGGSTLGSPTCTQQWNANVPNAITGTSSSIVIPAPGTLSCGWTASSDDFWDDVAVEIRAAG